MEKVDNINYKGLVSNQVNLSGADNIGKLIPVTMNRNASGDA